MQGNARKHRAPSPLGALLSMTLFAALTLAAVSLLFAAVTYLMSDPASTVAHLSLPAFLVSGAITALFLGRRKEGGMLTPTLAVSLLLLVLLLVGVLTGGTVSLRILLYDGAYLVTFLCVYLLSVHREKGRRHRSRRHG